MVFGPWIEVYTWLKSLKPTGEGFRRPHFNFITLHYIYMLSLTIIGSVIIYGGRNMAYIDALFFASGCATQSGLNTININETFLYQQITMYFIACIGNPIFINTLVVFIRLYWFEKRFQNVVLEAQKLRRTRSRSQNNTLSMDENDSDLIERGVGSRKITVMHPGVKTMDIAGQLANPDAIPMEKIGHRSDCAIKSVDEDSSGPEGDHSSSSTSAAPLPFRREITFADEVRPSALDDEHTSDRLPATLSPDQHIAFLENQRNPKDKAVLYIPGPRDFDRGDVPQQLGDDDFQGETSGRGTSVIQGPRTLHPSRFRNSEDNVSHSDHPIRDRIANKISFEEATNAVVKAKRWGLKWKKTAFDDDDEYEGTPSQIKTRSNTFKSFMTSSRDDTDPMPYLTWQPTVGRNSVFVNLTEEQREELGGIEYRALKTLAVVLCTYFFGFHLLGVVCLVPWFVRSGTYGPIAEQDGFSRVWWGIFTPASMFNDLGFTLNPDSMVSFQRAVFPLLFGSFLIVIGNTGFPCMLRFVIWMLSIIVPKSSSVWEELRFLLDHPRRCFTLLFPSKATWWLFWVLVLLNVIDLVFFIVLDLNDPIITVLPAGIRVLDGWFQAVSTRTAGFADVDLADLHPAIQVSYLVMMYISVFPIAISVRRTNVYEEKSLGIWAGDSADDESNEQSYVGAHLRRQLSFDLWYVFLGLFIIAIVEGTRIQNTNDYAFSIFSVLFEVVSAYGTVGLSLGYPNIDASFSAEFHVLSKLVIIAMQIRGRHRGLPYALDKAILLPSEGLQKKEEDDGNRRLSRRNSVLTQAGGALTPNPASGSAAADPYVEGQLVPAETTSTQRSGQGAKRRKGGIAKLVSSALSAGPALKEKMKD